MAEKEVKAKVDPSSCKLPEEVEKKYRCTIPAQRVVTTWNEEVDLRTITLEKAEELVKKGFKELVPVEASEEPAAPTGSSKTKAQVKNENS